MGSRKAVACLDCDLWCEEGLNVAESHGKEAMKSRLEEHRQWMWATDDQVRTRINPRGKTIEFVSEAAWRIVLEGLRLKAETDIASTRMT
jgi:hypothetical protein